MISSCAAGDDAGGDHLGCSSIEKLLVDCSGVKVTNFGYVVVILPSLKSSPHTGGGGGLEVGNGVVGV